MGSRRGIEGSGCFIGSGYSCYRRVVCYVGASVPQQDVDSFLAWVWLVGVEPGERTSLLLELGSIVLLPTGKQSTRATPN
jgi:hypothetical protein